MSLNVLNWIIPALVSYLVGGIPTAYLAARLLKGQDIRRVGDHNVGAANVYRNINAKAGIVVGMIDIAKGSAAVLLVRGLIDSTQAEMIAGVAVVAGHNWPVYFRLRGGRGAATAVGVLLAMLPAPAIPVGLLSLVVLYLTKKAVKSLGFFLICVPILAWWPSHYWWPAHYSYPLISYSVGIPLLVGISHYLSVKRASQPPSDGEPALRQG